jgi:iron complex outermembrane receptor protein
MRFALNVFQVFAASSAVIALSPLTAAAQAQLEEIIVTAERREATELTSALSLEVFSGSDLAENRLETVMDLERATPNLTIAHTGGGTQSVNIRGVGNSVVNPNIQPGVAIFQDGLIMAETIVIQSAFLDVGTIEVLRGPQGTFVGQSSTGGAVMINSASPNFDGINGFFEAVVGNYRDNKISGAINVPLSEKLSTRFAFSQESRDSYYTNLGDQGAGPLPGKGLVEIGEREDRSFRGSVLWQPNDSLNLTARIEMNSTDRRGSAPYKPNPRTFANPLDPDGVGEAQYAQAARVDGTLNEPFTLAWDRLDSFNAAVADRYSVDLRKTYDSGIEFRSLTGFQHNDYRYIEDFDATTANGSHALVDIGPDNDYYSQEFNLLSPDDGAVTWIVGASWFHRTTPVNLNFRDNNCGYDAATGGQRPCPPAGAIPAVLFISAETIQRHAGLFGQVTWRMSDAFELEVGVRNSWDNNIDRTAVTLALLGVPAPCAPSLRPGLPNPAAYGCVPLSDARAKHKDDIPTYKVGLNWTPADGQFFYVFYARGYKSGGVNNGLPFAEEIVDDIELGWKGEALDGRLRVQLGAFRMDYNQMQQSTFRVSTTSNSNSGSILNIGDSTIQGLELSLDAALGNLGLNFSAGYTDSDLGGINVIDARFVDPSARVQGAVFARGCAPGEAPAPGPAGCFNYSGNVISLSGAANLFSPELSYNLGLDYAFELSNGATLRPRIGLSHIDEQYSSLFQDGNYFQLEEHDLTHVSITLEKEAWMLQAYCNNCGDELYVATVGLGLGNTVVYGDPRTAGLRFNVRF